VLFSVWDHLPPGAVVTCVVDPGVGSRRKALIGTLEGKYVIAPDNGTISLLVRMKPKFPLWELDTGFLRETPSATFHGRDIFAPAAALAVRGKAKKIRGVPLQPVLLTRVLSKISQGSVAEGYLQHIDRFGNAVTTVHENDISWEREFCDIEFTARSHAVAEPFTVRLHGVKRTFSEASEQEPLAYIGSSGFLEIGIRNGSARGKYQLRQGTYVTVRKT